ncbi:MAG: hypothetical protein RLZZ540_314 [Bacteroidota bacterium]|jgi:glycosyltransferase involved in cell wall biosynthesis
MLAIIIPYYRFTFFDKTLQSLANQIDKRFKVYIGDDASPENPIELLEKYKGQFDFVYHRFETNLGNISLTKQWERCIALSSNEWLMILGDDDVLGENVIEEFYNNILEVKINEINVIRFASQKIDGNGKIISGIFEHPTIERAVQFLFDKTRSSLSEYIFRKQSVLTIGIRDFPLAWFSDVLAVLEFSNFDVIYTINKSVVSIRISSQSISGSSKYEKQKLQAKFEFYYYLVNNKCHFFSEAEVNELFFRLQKCYIDNRRQFLFFFLISKLYFKNLKFRDYGLFLKKSFLKNVYKVNNEK